jgi:hypothetical protein
VNTTTKIIVRVVAKIEAGAQPIDAVKAVAAEMQAEAVAMGWNADQVNMIPVTVGLACLSAA